MKLLTQILSRIPLRAEHFMYWRLKSKGFKGRYRSINGCRMHYVIKEGQSNLPWIVFIHGFSATAMHWHDVLLNIAKTGQTVVAVDMPGHGFSEEYPKSLSFDALFEATEKLINEITPNKFCLVGNSLGGAIALKYITANPDKIQSAVMISPAGKIESQEEWLRLKKVLTVKTLTQTREFLKRIYHRLPWYLPLILPTAIHNLIRPGLSQFLESVEKIPLGDFSSKVMGSTLFIWGQEDRLLPRTLLSWYKRKLPGVKIEEPANMGHCPHLDNPEWISQRILIYIAAKGER